MPASGFYAGVGLAAGVQLFERAPDLFLDTFFQCAQFRAGESGGFDHRVEDDCDVCRSDGTGFLKEVVGAVQSDRDDRCFGAGGQLEAARRTSNMDMALAIGQQLAQKMLERGATSK